MFLIMLPLGAFRENFRFKPYFLGKKGKEWEGPFFL